MCHFLLWKARKIPNYRDSGAGARAARRPATRRVNKEIGRSTDVVGSFPDDGAVIRLAGALLSKQNEWLAQRRYLSAESVA